MIGTLPGIRFVLFVTRRRPSPFEPASAFIISMAGLRFSGAESGIGPAALSS